MNLLKKFWHLVSLQGEKIKMVSEMEEDQLQPDTAFQTKTQLCHFPSFVAWDKFFPSLGLSLSYP